MGYYGIYLGLRYRSNQEIKAKLDADSYNKHETLQVKIPYTLPYQVDWKEYERVDGEFEHNGEFYKLVKHKLEHDTLYVVYIKDHRETDLFKSLVDFVQASSENPVSQKTLSFIKNLTKDYISTTSTLHRASVGWCQYTLFSSQKYQVITSFSPVFSPPPEIFL